MERSIALGCSQGCFSVSVKTDFVPVKIIGHRGLGSTAHLCGNGSTLPHTYFPENTLKSFQAAIDEGVDGLELDVINAACGTAMVIHDDRLNTKVEGAAREGTDCGRVSALSAAEIQRLNVGQGEAPPTLQQTLDLFADANLKRQAQGLDPLIIQLELKGCDVVQTVTTAIRPMIDAGLFRAEDFHVCSFDHAQLVTFKRANPDIEVSPAITTTSLFGDDQLMPGWTPVPGATYRDEVFGELDALQEDMLFTSLDCVMWDVYRPMVNYAVERGHKLYLSISNVRDLDERYLLIVLAAQRAGAEVCLITDEPTHARRALQRLSDELDDATLCEIWSIVAEGCIDPSHSGAGDVCGDWSHAATLTSSNFAEVVLSHPPQYQRGGYLAHAKV